MTTEVEIRDFRPEDVQTVIEIQEAIIQRKVAPRWLNIIQLQLTKPEGVSLVAVRDGEVIGFFFGDVKHGDFGLEHSGWIEMFGVNPKMMGEGIGRSLAQAAFERFKQHGVMDIYTAVNWDSGDLLAFFKKIGFDLSNFITLNTRIE